MPPKPKSRHFFCKGVYDENGWLFLTAREPYRFKEHPDTRIHKVVEGDTLFSLAGRYFAPLPRACGFWWVIADFQKSPIIDPTVKLEIGSQIHVPSLRVLNEIILSPIRRLEV